MEESDSKDKKDDAKEISPVKVSEEKNKPEVKDEKPGKKVWDQQTKSFKIVPIISKTDDKRKSVLNSKAEPKKTK